MAENAKYTVVVKGQLEQMAQYGQILVATVGVMLSVIGGLVTVGGLGHGGFWFGASITLLVASFVSGFFEYGYVVSSYYSPVSYSEYKSGAASHPLALSATMPLAGSEGLLVKSVQFRMIRVWALVQFITMLAAAGCFLVGLFW